MRVLIPTVTAGAGHLQAAAALEEAWRALRPADDVRRVDVLDYTPRWYRKIYVQGYLKLIQHAPDPRASRRPARSPSTPEGAPDKTGSGRP